MGLFGKRRDINFFKRINKEVINKLIDQYIYIYNIKVEQTSNVYGERVDKSYSNANRISAIVERTETNYINTEKGLDSTRSIEVLLLRENLLEMGIFIYFGDIILWDNEYYEVTFIDENQNLFGKDPKDDLSPDRDSGSNFSLKIKATKVNNINLE